MKKTLAVMLSMVMLFVLAASVSASTITIDGKFDESFWSDKWTTVNSANGKWQTALKDGATRDQGYDYQYVVDGDFIYVAIKTNYAPIGVAPYGNGNGTNVRFWTFVEGNKVDGTAYTLYNNFVNFAYNPDGDVLTIYKNSKATENKAVVMDTPAGTEAKGIVKDNSWHVELKIPFKAFGATESLEAYVTVSSPLSIADSKAVENNALFFPVFPAGTTDDTFANAPFKKWDSASALKINVKAEEPKTEEPVSEEPATEEPETPATNDSTVIFAVVALVSIFGTAYVVKARKA